jgi:hypothetical protein
MLPRDLHAANFDAYPPQARQLAVQHLTLFQQLPLSFLPSLLRELIEYDYKFPVERIRIEQELSILSDLPAPQLAQWFHAFAALDLAMSLECTDWVAKPAQFIEKESAYLWSTHQQDSFREAAVSYGDRLQSARPLPSLPTARLGIAIIGQGTATTPEPLFLALRKHGTFFSQIKPEGGLEVLLAATEARAAAHPIDYAHWYIDGGAPNPTTKALTTVSYSTLAPVRDKLLSFMQTQIARPGMGPEELRTELAQMSPAQLGMERQGDPVLDRFQVKIFTEGSGTQIFSTTFAQWTTREALRRAEPLTLLVRYAPRQRQKPMNELLANTISPGELDPAGSLVDANMAAYYHWVNQQRLHGAEQSSFLVWWEGQHQAVVIAPTLPRRVTSGSALTLKQLLSLATG